MTVRVRDLVIERGGRLVVDRVRLDAQPGHIVGIIGPNGAGKSSLLLALFRALEPRGGDVLIDDQLLSGMDRREIARTMAVVQQNPEGSLPLSVWDSVMLGRLAHRSLVSYGNAEDRQRVRLALEQVGVQDLADRLFTELSGGERQRVLIARAIVQDADHLLLDEPTNHLDLHHQFSLLNLVKQLRATTVIVLHDLNMAARTCDDLLLLDHGRVVASGPTSEVLEPDLIGRVYGVGVDAVEHQGRRHLLFHA